MKINLSLIVLNYTISLVAGAIRCSSTWRLCSFSQIYNLYLVLTHVSFDEYLKDNFIMMLTTAVPISIVYYSTKLGRHHYTCVNSVIDWYSLTTVQVTNSNKQTHHKVNRTQLSNRSAPVQLLTWSFLTV